MPLTLGWKEIALRLALTVLAGIVIGFNRSEAGRPAGMRTTLLVCLAASLSMIQANLLLPTVGKAGNSFVVLDLMRLPLGVLSGMGFIGAGTILRKGDLVVGVTTAATLWYVTLLGLCFGGGQIELGVAGLVLGCATLWGLRYFEHFITQDERAALWLTIGDGGPTDAQVKEQLARDRCTIRSWGISYFQSPERREICCQIQWRRPPDDLGPPAAIEKLRVNPAVTAIRWEPSQRESKPGGSPVAPTRS
jgi:putative Mg2+ transporter-C (MgtC) family protein